MKLIPPATATMALFAKESQNVGDTMSRARHLHEQYPIQHVG
jgi:hypothetical protein